MGNFTELEVRKYKRYYVIMGIGGGVFLLGLILLIFGRSYILDGSNYDLLLVFGVMFMVIGFTVAAVPFVLQMKMFYTVRKRADYVDAHRFAGPPPSAAGQAFSNYPPMMASPAASTIDQKYHSSHPQQFSAAAAMMQYSGSQDHLRDVPGSTGFPTMPQQQDPYRKPAPVPSYPVHSQYNTGYSSQI